MELATQEQLDKFKRFAVSEPKIYPYLSVSKWLSEWTAPKDDWDKIMFVNKQCTAYLRISISRSDDNGFSIACYTLSSYWAGRCMLLVKELIKRYDPKYIQTCVHISNIKSLNINEKLLGKPWGVEPLGAWNSLLGKYEDLVWFKKILK